MLTVYFKRKPPESVYAVRNEQGFHTPGVFSCNAFSFRSSGSYRWLTVKHLLCQRLQTLLEQRDGLVGHQHQSIFHLVIILQQNVAGRGAC